MPSKPIVEQLRVAVTSRSYAEVDQLLLQYRNEVESCWKASSEDQRRLIASETMSLLEWVRRTILVSRSHAQHRHAQCARQNAYSEAAIPRSAVNLDA